MMELPKRLKDEIWEYCRLNDIPNIDDFITKMIQQGYTVEKFGSTPINSGNVTEVEKIVEVPVEVIKEVIIEKEVIKEIPVEKIVTKVEYISDETTKNELTEKIFHLDNEMELQRQNFSIIFEKMENNFQKEMSKKDEELDELRQNLDDDDRDIKILELTQLFNNEVFEHKKTKEKMSKKDEELDELRRKLDEIEKKNNNDIYGDERRGGWFGSNILNRK